MEVGAVAAMRYVSDGIKAARLVMQHTKHTMLVGEQASVFAISMGLPGPANLSSEESIDKWIKWKENKCQPNFRKNVLPVDDCGPYHATNTVNLGENICRNSKLLECGKLGSCHISLHNHDTISMAVIDKVSCLFSSNFYSLFCIIWIGYNLLFMFLFPDGTYCCWYIN